MNSPLARAQNTILVWQKKCDAKDLEIERLRSALERIAEHDPSVTGAVAFYEVRDIAREALRDE